jgi:tyrosinase
VAKDFPSLLLTRRDALTGALALAAVPWAATTSARGADPVLRRSVTAADFPAETLQSFKRAIRAMLALPPSDPRNWYRQALIHLFDCPHANWWFLPWHRGYLLHFEEISRDLSGDAKFALPYWDWTTSSRVPDALFEDVLTPTHELYEESLETFRPKFEPAIAALWSAASPAQRDQLTLRGYASPDDIWQKLQGYFAARDVARGPTREAPELPDWAKTEVGSERVMAALAPKRFEDFGSTASENHHQRAIQDTLESGPHNNIHNAIGGGFGFMSELMAPVDPIFWLHHANVDRLWDVWSRRERKAGRTALPDNVAGWKREPFLFFSTGEALSERYLETSELGYGYSKGFGEEVLDDAEPVAPSTRGAPVPATSGAATFEGEKGGTALRTDAEASASVRVPNALLVAARTPKKAKRGGAHSGPSPGAEHAEELELVARISMAPPQNPRAVRVLFFMNCSYLSPETPIADPHYVGSVTFFGLHGAHHGAQVVATLPLNSTLQRLAAAGEPVTNQVKLQGIATRDSGALQAMDGALVQVSVKSV